VFVVVSCKLGFCKNFDFLNGNINVQIFYIECECLWWVLMRSFTGSLVRQLELVVL